MLGAELVEFNGEPDHVHLLVSYPPMLYRSASWCCRLKGASATSNEGRLHRPCNRAGMHGHFWTPSYFAVSSGRRITVGHQVP